MSLTRPVSRRGKSKLSKAEREALAAYRKHKRMKAHLRADSEEAIEQGSFKELVTSLDIFIGYRVRLLQEELIKRGQIRS